MSFEFRPTDCPRIYVLAHKPSGELIVTLAFDPEMTADRRETWQAYLLQKLNAGDVLAQLPYDPNTEP